MHRSGTSFVARMLHDCGVYLGPDDELASPAPDNAEGFWEDPRFVSINDEILSRLGGGWDMPPLSAHGWEDRPDLASLRARAADLVSSAPTGVPWGWKDPRNSLTLPFWRRIVPSLKIIICLRHPLEVQRSLAKRGFSSPALGLKLWLHYSLRLLETTAVDERIVTHYDTYFDRPKAELERVASFLNLPVPMRLDAAAASIARRLRHSEFSFDDLLSARVPAAVIAVYRQMCDEAGLSLVPTEARSSIACASQPTEVRSGSAEASEVLVNLLRDRLSDAGVALTRVEAELEQARAELSHQKLAHEQAVESATALRADLEAITESAGWSLLQEMRRVRLALVPRGTRRERAFTSTLRMVQRAWGWGLWARARRALGMHAPRPPGSVKSESLVSSTTYDVICFPVIDWEYRFQRPQQILGRFAAKGHRVFYLRMRFNGVSSARLETLGHGIYGLSLPGPPLDPYRDRIPADAVDALVRAVEQFRGRACIDAAVAILQLPFWTPLAVALRQRFGWRIVYDCIDDHAGFSTNHARMLGDEETLLRTADLAVASSQTLHRRVSSLNPRAVFLPNATDFEHFHDAGVDNPLAGLPHPVVGYYGAISDWFDVDMVRSAAASRPAWQFVLIGDTRGADVSGLRRLSNVRLLGEKPYASLPGYLHAFDVACIPFLRTRLTDATNPVKFYEYLSAGKPVVAANVPDLEPFREYFYPVDSAADFVPQVEAALREDSPDAARARIDFARQNTWEARQGVLSTALSEIHGRAAIVIVSYDNPAYLRQCLESVFTRTLYPNFEVIVVDNGSDPEVVDYLHATAAREARLRVIANGENLGFARANNIGIAAVGECTYLVLLNDDTIVTRGWLPRMIGYLDRPQVGLVGPVTNWCGNEARIEADYSPTDGIEEFARRRALEHEGQWFEIPMLAMFCVGLRRSVFDQVGPLDERFGIGMFEDDDYSLRVKNLGLRVICAEDLFIHHWGRASFSRIAEPEYRRLFEANRGRFEEKWGKAWKPHKTRVAGEDR